MSPAASMLPANAGFSSALPAKAVRVTRAEVMS
jgi:hypothetical protein